MKKLLVAAIALLGFATAAHAAESKIAVCDSLGVINGTNAAKRAVATLTSKRDAAQAKINGMEKPLIDKQNKLMEQKAVMAPDKFQAAQQDFGKDLAKFRADAQQIQADLDKDNLALRKQIAEAVTSAVEAIAKEKGYDLVLPKGITIYSSADVPDISADALARANKILDK